MLGSLACDATKQCTLAHKNVCTLGIILQLTGQYVSVICSTWITPDEQYGDICMFFFPGCFFLRLKTIHFHCLGGSAMLVS